MVFDTTKIIYLTLLLFVFYGCLKALLEFRKERDIKYLMLLVFFLIISPHLWVKANRLQAQELLITLQFTITLIPLALFLFYDHGERKRREEQRDKIRIKTFFERYVNPKIIQEVLQSEKLSLEGQKREVTVFFMDIRDFTRMSESLPAERVVKILNEYFNIATNILFKYDGTVDKFVGDSVMALFNAPTQVKNHRLKAVQAAMEIQEEIKKWGKVKVGIGIHSGAAIVGNIGSKHKMDYTAIGDVVNTASRLEGQTKAGEILVSKEIYAEVKEMFPTKYKENVMLKGKTNRVEVYRYKS